MSGGGSSSVDPYHEKAPPKKQPKKSPDSSAQPTKPSKSKDPPKKKKKQRLKPSELPSKPIGPVKVLLMPKFGRRPITGQGYTGLNWYKCDHCGEIYLKRKPADSPRSFCGPKCENDWKSGYQKGRKFSEEHRKKIGESKIGRPRSEDTKKKVSDARKELYKTPEFREKMNEVNRRPDVREKRSESKRGSRNPNWKGGSSEWKRTPTPADEYRNTMDWRRKSEEIRERDNNTCAGCGYKGEDGTGLDVHHTYPLNDWIDDGNDPADYPDDWLMTLDKSCHSKADSQSGDFKFPPKE